MTRPNQRTRTIIRLVAFLAALAAAGWLRPVQAQEFDLAAALAQAEPGATILVPPGVYSGPLTIAQPVTLAGEPGAVIQGDGRGDVVIVTAPDVTLRGFVIRNSGDSLDREHAGIVGLAPRLTVEDNRLEDTLFGIYLKNAPNSVIRGNTVFSKKLDVARRGDGIRVWYSDGPVVENNHVVGSRDVVIWFSPNGLIRQNLVEDGRYGLHFMFSDNQIVEQNTLVGNSVGIYTMYGRNLALRRNWIEENHGPSGYGIGLKDADDIVVEDNIVLANRVGVYVDNSPREPNATVRFVRNLFAYNEIGVTMLPLVRRNIFTANTFADNGEQAAVSGNGDLMNNQWAEAGVGNYWSDYSGFDADGNRVGDLPYAAVSLYESLLGRYPELRLFQLSPAVQTLDLAARAFPIFQPRPKLTDPHPLMAPPSPNIGQASLPASAWVATAANGRRMAMTAALLAAGGLAAALSGVWGGLKPRRILR
ncbi:MAG TPA: nitrous oxide reductase family maturation protein NosD [Caldilineaceae bacterium]|nr:nitrous oxide reductase family maturation protein NosD [Caldilineaceae bacterium]